VKYSTKSWDKIETFYKELPGTFAPMIKLVNHITTQNYSEHLHPTTSMSTLMIGRYQNFDAGDPKLLIE